MNMSAQLNYLHKKIMMSRHLDYCLDVCIVEQLI